MIRPQPTHRHVSLFVGQCLDGITFVIFMALLPATLATTVTEQNPITSLLMANLGFQSVLLVKVALGGVVLLRARPLVPKPGPYHAIGRGVYHSVFILAMYSGFVGAAFNAYAIGQMLGILGWI